MHCQRRKPEPGETT